MDNIPRAVDDKNRIFKLLDMIEDRTGHMAHKITDIKDELCKWQDGQLKDIYFMAILTRFWDQINKQPTTRIMTNLDRFTNIFMLNLAELIQLHPERYAFSLGSLLEEKGDRFKKAFESGDYDQHGEACKMTCKQLGLKNTRTAINQYLKG